MKQVLITGAYGFLGRHTAQIFKKYGHHVVGLGHGKWHPEDYAKWGVDEWVESTITFESLMTINKKFDIIIHCGGSGAVGFSYSNPYEDFQKSVQSTLSLLEYIRLQSLDAKFIYASSPAVQGNLGNIKITENMPSTPVSPYGVHKKIAEELCRSYHLNYNLQIGIIRFFSIYGEGLQKQLLWDACKKMQASNNVSFFGTGKETRDWIHVSDAVALIKIFSAKLNGYQVINGGYGKPTEIKDVLELLKIAFNKDVKINFNGQVKEGDPTHFWADNSNALLLEWKPKIDLKTGLKMYVSYFENLT